eukprot:3470368-Prymnesium_polylepis.1
MPARIVSSLTRHSLLQKSRAMLPSAATAGAGLPTACTLPAVRDSRESAAPPTTSCRAPQLLPPSTERRSTSSILPWSSTVGRASANANSVWPVRTSAGMRKTR